MEPILITVALLIVGYFWWPVVAWKLATVATARENASGAHSTEG